MALQCGLTRGQIAPIKFVFNKNNGSLYYFDVITAKFKPLTKRVEEGAYFNSMSEFSSRLEEDKLLITRIDYFQKDAQQKSIVKNIINLKSLAMNTIYLGRTGNKVRIKGNCVWIDPKYS